jgi:hypothetical protein
MVFETITSTAVGAAEPRAPEAIDHLVLIATTKPAMVTSSRHIPDNVDAARRLMSVGRGRG